MIHGRCGLPCLVALVALARPAAARASGGGDDRDPPPVRILPDVAFHGSIRTRGSLLVNLDLDRGPQPTSGAPVFPESLSGGEALGSADARVRLDLGITVGDLVRARLRVDALDGLVLGSTPEGFPATRWSQTPWASTRQEPPAEGVNAFVDSIRLEEAYGEVLTPFGVLAFGRMSLPKWGLGVVTGRAEDIDQDFDDPVDRVGFATSFLDHFVGVAFDWNAVGPTSADSQGGLVSGQDVDLELRDNLYTFSVSAGRAWDPAAIARRSRAGKASLGYGAYVTYRWQRVDFPTYYLSGVASEDLDWGDDEAVERRLGAFLADVWLRLDAGRVRAEVEGAVVRSRVDDPSVEPTVSLPPLTALQAGGALEVEVAAVPGRLWVQAGAGIASGDRAPGLGVAPPVGQAGSQPGDLDGPQFSVPGDMTVDNFRFHPNFTVDQVFWRRIVGTVTDAVYVRPELRASPGRTLDLRLSATASWAVFPGSTPGGERFYGTELDLRADWHPVRGFEARGGYGLFLPGPALSNPEAGLAATPAHAGRLVLAVVW